MLMYGFGIILNGWIADKVNTKVFFMIGSSMSVVMYSSLGLLGMCNYYSVNLYIFIFGADGFF